MGGRPPPGEGIYSWSLNQEWGENERSIDSLAGNPEKRFYSGKALSDLSSGHGGTESLCGELLWIGQPGCSVWSGGIGHLEIESNQSAVQDFQLSNGIGSQPAAQVGAAYSFIYYCFQISYECLSGNCKYEFRSLHMVSEPCSNLRTSQPYAPVRCDLILPRTCWFRLLVAQESPFNSSCHLSSKKCSGLTAGHLTQGPPHSGFHFLQNLWLEHVRLRSYGLWLNGIV